MYILNEDHSWIGFKYVYVDACLYEVPRSIYGIILRKLVQVISVF